MVLKPVFRDFPWMLLHKNTKLKIYFSLAHVSSTCTYVSYNKLYLLLDSQKLKIVNVKVFPQFEMVQIVV